MAQNQSHKKDQPAGSAASEKSAVEKAKNPEKAEKSAVALREEEILAFWREKGIFKKSVEKNSSKKGIKSSDGVVGEFFFYDGPPFANGQPHYGHILPGTVKDVIPRFKTMRGYYVERQWGWDCHGLPVENLIEKELGLKSKKDIIEYGIGKFNEKARTSVMRYADDWKRIIPRTGRWVNMDDDYKTMDTSYTESVWWSFKTMHDKGLVYEGFKSMPLCPHCETTLSNFEVNQGYKDITDISVYVKFELVDEPGTYLLAWTTTPWTLPGNVALAVNPKMEYQKLTLEDGTKVIFASERQAHIPVLKDLKEKGGERSTTGGENIPSMTGADLVGKAYKPIFNYYAGDASLKNHENGWKVYAADFVTTEDGTGIVHIAPAFGAEDMELGEREKLPFVQHVTTDGKFKPEVTDFAGMAVKPKDSQDDPNAHQKADIEIIKYLARPSQVKQAGMDDASVHAGAGEGSAPLFAKEKMVHSYPHCWRCDTPLLNYAASSWFIKVTALKEKLLKNNATVNWLPENIRDGRFGKWLEGAKDWAVSRSRFWGAPIPAWRCDTCKRLEMIGSIAELKEKITPRNTYYVMRHGQADSNTLGIIDSSSHRFHLTEKGRADARESARALKSVVAKDPASKSKQIDLVITSPFNRTKETGEIVRAELGLDLAHVHEDDRIHEINVGVFNGKPLKEFHAYFASYSERFTKTPPEGENQNDVRKRVGQFLYELDKAHEGKTILIVTHDTPSWMLFSAAAGWNQKEALAAHPNDKPFLSPAEARKMEFVPLPHNELYEIDLHRPHIDEVTYSCAAGHDIVGHSAAAHAKGANGQSKSCAGTMLRVPEVFDTWYDSGSMPFASRHFPFAQQNDTAKGSMFDRLAKKFTKAPATPFAFPADFIAESIDQTRGWFYTLIVLSTVLFDMAPYKTVVVNGTILAEDGRKMSKSLKNYPEISEVLNRFGADAFRYFLMSSPVVNTEDLRFSEKGIDEVYKKVIMRLRNVCSFYDMYAGELEKDTSASSGVSAGASKNPLDRWILARLREAGGQITENLESYHIEKASRPIDMFVDDLSTWYLRRSRDRFKGDDKEDMHAALAVTRQVLKEFATLCAPFMPFIAEDIYLRTRSPQDPESVHLADWPYGGGEQPTTRAAGTASAADQAVISNMAEVRKIVTLGLEARAKAGIKVRQPLAELRLPSSRQKLLSDGLADLVRDELNVKAVAYRDDLQAEVGLDTVLTDALKDEGVVRELSRAIQDMRKKIDLQPSDAVTLTVDTAGAEAGLKKLIEINRDDPKRALCKSVGLKQVVIAALPAGAGEELKIEGSILRMQIEK